MEMKRAVHMKRRVLDGMLGLVLRRMEDAVVRGWFVTVQGPFARTRSHMRNCPAGVHFRALSP